MIVSEALIVGCGYAAAALVLLHPRLRFDLSLQSLRDLRILLSVAVLSSAAVTLAYIALVWVADRFEPLGIVRSAIRYWLGDVIGIVLILTFGLVVVKREHFFRLSWPSVLQALTLSLATAIAVSAVRDGELQFFYFLFVPVIWVAVSNGLEGVSAALTVTEIALFVALKLSGTGTINTMDLQTRMLILSITGFVAGALVSERQRADQKLLENQAVLARHSRLNGMGELAATIAHEVNQPLSAAGTYSRLVTESLAEEKLIDRTIIDTAEKAAEQIERAASVIKRVKALVQTGRGDMLPISPAALINQAINLADQTLQKYGISLRVKLEEDLPPVLADQIQIEQLLINLLRNSAEALAHSPKSRKQIVLRAEKVNGRRVVVSVSDSGPGFPKRLAGTPPVLLSSGKPEGLGIGLSLCRSIAEAHGGTLRLSSGEEGAQVSFTLAIAWEKKDAG
jgi:signal transduction histidine kinase